jgi:alpha-L-fucosidase
MKHPQTATRALSLGAFNPKRWFATCFVLLWTLLALCGSSVTAKADYTIPSHMQWWSDARFGMFIHFGSYSHQQQGEWIFHWGGYNKQNYHEQVTKPFNPTSFDAGAIVTAAKNAGMKYIVITAKHHEGLAMWNRTAATSFKDYTGTTIYSLPAYTTARFSRDLLMELKNECVAQGLKFCLYYSILDWSHPSQVNRAEGPGLTTMSSLSARTAYIAQMKLDLEELITRYDPALLWFDGDWFNEPQNPTLEHWWLAADGQDLYNFVKSKKSTIIVNERVKRDFHLADYAVAEFGTPTAPMERPWERCITMNGAWGYDSAYENQSSYRPVKDLVRELVTIASREGNYLLNIGPDATGAVPSLATSRLSGMAAWTSVWGASIYGTTRSPFLNDPSWGTATKKSGFLYCHVFNWPGGTLAVPAITNTITRAYVLNNPAVNLNYTISGGTINITVPSQNPDSTATDAVVVIECVGVPVAAPQAQIVPNGTYKITARHSGKAIAPSGSTNGSVVQQKTATGSNTFKWKLVHVGNNQYTIQSVSSGRYLDVLGVSTADGADVVIWDGTGQNNQKWTVQSAGGGYYTLTAVHSGKALDVLQASTANGAKVIQWTLTGSVNQQWTIAP